MRLALAVASFMFSGSAWAADLTSHVGRQVIMSPTAPLGVASDFPKSPLTESLLEGSARFLDEHRAQAACPSDLVVWVENGSKTYRLVRDARASGSGYGAYLCQAEALAEGDEPAFDRTR